MIGPSMWLWTAILGCGLGKSPTERSNVSACESYVRHLNGMGTCAGLIYDPDNLCTGTDFGADMSPYYDCLVSHSRCEGDRLLLEVDGCEPPLVVLSAPGTGEVVAEHDAALRSVQEGDR